LRELYRPVWPVPRPSRDCGRSDLVRGRRAHYAQHRGRRMMPDSAEVIGFGYTHYSLLITHYLGCKVIVTENYYRSVNTPVSYEKFSRAAQGRHPALLVPEQGIAGAWHKEALERVRHRAQRLLQQLRFDFLAGSGIRVMRAGGPFDAEGPTGATLVVRGIIRACGPKVERPLRPQYPPCPPGRARVAWQRHGLQPARVHARRL